MALDRTLLLFDIDGTLLLTGGAGMRAMARAARGLYGDAFSWDGIEASGGLDPLIFGEAARRNGRAGLPHEHEAFRAAYLQALPEELARSPGALRVMPGVLEVLTLLRDRAEVVLGLLTGNYAHAVPLKLAAAGIDPGWFPVGAFGDEAESRPALVELARERYRRRHGAEVAPGRVVLVGDTPRDVHAALANGALAFAVATGKYSVEELLTSGAHRAVKDLSDPAPLLRLIEDGGPAGNG